MEHAAHSVDILNKEGVVVGKKFRRDIDKLKDIHHSVHVLLITPTGELILGLIPDREDLPNLYSRRLGSTVATIKRTGETAKKAAIRSLARELFIDDAEVVLLGEKMFKLPERLNFISAYYMVANPPTAFSLLDVDTLGVIAPNQLRKMLLNEPDKLAPTLKAIWEEFGHKLPV